MWEPLLSFSCPPRAQVPSSIRSSSFSLLTMVLPDYSGNISYPFKYLRSSARVQQLLCEIYSTSRCILDTFMERRELHVLLLLLLHFTPVDLI